MRRHSPYNYAFDNPLRFIDPDGMKPNPSGIGKENAAPDEGIAKGLKEIDEEAQESFRNWLSYYSGSGLRNVTINRDGSAQGYDGDGNSQTINAPDYGGGSDDRNPAQDKKLSPDDIAKLKKRGWSHYDKGNSGGQTDLWYDPKSGEIYQKPKDGKGSGEPIGWNINDVRKSWFQQHMDNMSILPPSPLTGHPAMRSMTPEQAGQVLKGTAIGIAAAFILVATDGAAAPIIIRLIPALKELQKL